MKNRSHLKVYVLIQIVPGRVEAVMKALRRLSSVVTADSVTGPYDVVALIEVSEVRELSQLVAGAIGGIRGVTRTTTLICT
ncbi:MAG TPA: Lrp/AsnC ligand binding domain-containing protein [Vicinamibacteria bacterium]|nr:Lrp/AsnC ligand binding domain-containing protein [Vicinamibacteria bacterium]